MARSDTLALAVLAWQLPLNTGSEDAAVSAVEEVGRRSGYRAGDLALVLQELTTDWVVEGQVAPLLRAALDAALRHTPAILNEINATSYLAIYRRLRNGGGDVPALHHVAAQRLLSRASLVAHLLREERASCSQVARLLASTERVLDVPYGAVVGVARQLGLTPSLDTADEQLAWDEDQLRSLSQFPDSTLAETHIIAAVEISEWIPEVQPLALLRRIAGDEAADTEPFWPYLQILHWCLLPAEYFDHPVSYLYEFKPRGAVAAALFDRYPTATGNPVLNNAKAVETLNATWARNRGGDDAHALVALLTAIESLPFVPRRQVARMLRAWLVRVIELRTVTPVPLQATMGNEEIWSLIERVSTSETNTQGVIEQRVVDFLAVLAYQRDGWRPRGLGDGVNASNFSRQKLGDVEFTNVDDRIAIAIEAHSGYLSATYVADHRRSLARIVRQRLNDSWATLDDPERWSIRLVFISHERDVTGLPTSETLHGVTVNYEYIDYAQLTELALSSTHAAQQHQLFHGLVIDALNRPTVRERVRVRFRALLESDSAANSQ